MDSAPPAERLRDLDAWHMRRALALAELGQGKVEPNPMVGCVIARGAEIVGEGWHTRSADRTPRSKRWLSPGLAPAGARCMSRSNPVATRQNTSLH